MSGWAQLLAACERLHRASPALMAFADWPDDLSPNHKTPVPLAATAMLDTFDLSTPLISELKSVAATAEWRQTYNAHEVGDHFLQSYGYFELYGPNGHYHSDQARGYIAFWGPNLDYPDHHHEAEEIYLSLAGTPRFTSQSQPHADLAPGQTRRHAPWEVHGMQTRDTAFFCYAVWKGAGLAGLPAIAPNVAPGAAP